MDKVYIIVVENEYHHRVYKNVMCFSSQMKANDAISELRKQNPTKFYELEVHDIDPM